MGFSILLPLRLILLAFYVDFTGCGIDRKSTSITCHFSDLLLFAGLLKNNLQLVNPPRLSM
jgi:hypothetical protein